LEKVKQVNKNIITQNIGGRKKKVLVSIAMTLESDDGDGGNSVGNAPWVDTSASAPGCHDGPAQKHQAHFQIARHVTRSKS